MPKVYTKIGFGVTQEQTVTEGGETIGTGIWTREITERYYYGELTQPISRWSVAQQVNDDKTISTTISIVADPFATDHWNDIRYVEFMGTNWRVVSVEIQYPRLILSIGGEYIDG